MPRLMLAGGITAAAASVLLSSDNSGMARMMQGGAMREAGRGTVP